MKAAATVLLMLALVTAAANVWVVGSLNRRYIPQACAQAEILLERKVSHSSLNLDCPALNTALSQILSLTGDAKHLALGDGSGSPVGPCAHVRHLRSCSLEMAWYKTAVFL